MGFSGVLGSIPTIEDNLRSLTSKYDVVPEAVLDLSPAIGKSTGQAAVAVHSQ
jgi:hypothetical protein